MTDQIFAGKLSLTDDIPEQPPVFTRSPERVHVGTQPFLPPNTALADGYRTTAEQIQGMWNYVKDTYGRPKPLPESGLSPAARRVRAEAARLGIDYDAEVAKILSRMKGGGMGGYLPGPYNKKAGPDPLKNVSATDRRFAETAAAEIIRREHGITLTWE